MTEDEMVGWQHQLNGCESEKTMGDNEEQGRLAYCSSWSPKELDTTERPIKSKGLQTSLCQARLDSQLAPRGEANTIGA